MEKNVLKPHGGLRRKENEYVSTKNIGRALEEVAKNLIHIDGFEKPIDEDTNSTK